MLPSLLGYLMVYISGFLMVFHFSEWFLVWVGLELIMFGFVILIYSGSVESVESCYSYFFVQSLGSGILLGVLYWGGWGWVSEVILWYKIGVGPFYFWYVSVMKGLSWMGCYMLMTFQSVAPLVILWDVGSVFSWVMLVFSIMIGIGGSVCCVDLKMLMGFSSVHYLGWILLGQLVEGDLWGFYFIGYMIMLSGVLGEFCLSSKGVGEVVGLGLGLVLSLLVLGGVPPFLGFVIKWLVLVVFVKLDFIMSVFLAVCAVIMCYVYLRVGYSIMVSGGFSSSYWVSGKSWGWVINIFGGLMLLVVWGVFV